MINKGKNKDSLWERRYRTLKQILYKGVTNIPMLYNGLKIKHHIIMRDVKFFEEDLKFISMFNNSNVVSMLFAPPPNPRYFSRLEKNKREKKAISKFVFENYIRPGDKIYIESSTTNLLLAYFIACSPYENLDITTNDISILRFLIERIKPVRIVGGMLRNDLPHVMKSDLHDLSREGIKKSFIGFDGLSYEDGVFCSYEYVDTQRDVALATKDLIVFVGDHSKIGKTPRTRFISFDELKQGGKNYIVVTDNNFEDNQVRSAVEGERKKFPEGKFIIVDVPEE